MKSISFYITINFIKFKGIKSIFSKSPVNYQKLRKNDIKNPNKLLLSGNKINSLKISESVVSEIIPQNCNNNGTVIFYCPGGAFVSGPTDINWKAILKIAKETNLKTFLIDYPKAPETKIETMNSNIDSIYRYLSTQNYTKNIILLGDSVGGTLLMLLVQRLSKLVNTKMPKCIFLISPVTDCSLTNPEILLKDKKDSMLSRNGVLSAKLMCARNIDLKSEVISPLYGSFKNFITTNLFIAENDIMQPAQELLVDKMIAENVNLKVYRRQEMPHIFPLFYHL